MAAGSVPDGGRDSQVFVGRESMLPGLSEALPTPIRDSAPVAKHKVLVAEPSVSLRKCFARALNSIGCEVIEAVNEIDAVRVLGTVGIPSAFVVSSNLGSGKGVAFARGLGTLEKTKNRPVLLVADDSLMRHFKEKPLHGAVTPVWRSAPIDELVNTITAVISNLLQQAPDQFRLSFDNSSPVLQAQVAALDGAYSFFEKVVRMVNEGKLPGPMVPDVLARVLRLFADPDVKFADIARFCAQHQALAARLLAVTNSAFYSTGGARITTVDVAISRLGLRQTAALLQSLAAQAYVVGSDPVLRKMITDNLEKSYAAALVSTEIARLTGYSRAGELYFVALFHNIGSTFLFYTLAILRDKGTGVFMDPDAVKTMALNRAADLNRMLYDKMKLPIEIVGVMESNVAGASGQMIEIVHQAIWVVERLVAARSADALELDSEAQAVGVTPAIIDMIKDKAPSLLGTLSEYTVAAQRG